MKFHDWRKIKIHQSYTHEELATTLDINPTTVYRWRHKGLQPIDSQRPVLFSGAAARTFVRSRNKSNYQPAGPGRMHCLRCRGPREPDGNGVEYLSLAPHYGALRGRCAECGTQMYRRVRFTDLQAAMPGILVRFKSEE